MLILNTMPSRPAARLGFDQTSKPWPGPAAGGEGHTDLLNQWLASDTSAAQEFARVRAEKGLNDESIMTSPVRQTPPGGVHRPSDRLRQGPPPPKTGGN
jgi:hypothetical protein